MQRYRIAFLIACFIFGFTTSTSAQQSNPIELPEGQIINGKAVLLVTPEYPPEANGANGAVNVQISIDENGDVYSAKATSGNPLLHAAAIAAAKKSKYSPTIFNGQPVKVTGSIIYNFASPKPDYTKQTASFTFGTYLYFLRGLVGRLSLMKEFAGANGVLPEDVLKDLPQNYAGLDEILAPLGKLAQISPTKRLAVIDKVIAKVKKKLLAKDVWQFKLGTDFGDLLAQILKSSKEGSGLDFAKLDKQAVKTDLANIKVLINTAPKEFPAPVLEKFKQLVALHDKNKAITPEIFNELFAQMLEVMNTISPR